MTAQSGNCAQLWSKAKPLGGVLDGLILSERWAVLDAQNADLGLVPFLCSKFFFSAIGAGESRAGGVSQLVQGRTGVPTEQLWSPHIPVLEPIQPIIFLAALGRLSASSGSWVDCCSSL